MARRWKRNREEVCKSPEYSHHGKSGNKTDTGDKPQRRQTLRRIGQNGFLSDCVKPGKKPANPQGVYRFGSV